MFDIPSYMYTEVIRKLNANPNCANILHCDFDNYCLSFMSNNLILNTKFVEMGK